MGSIRNEQRVIDRQILDKLEHMENLEEILKIRDEEIARLRAALEEIAKQQFTDEMPAEEYLHGDYERAYDLCVDTARKALEQE